MRIHFNDEQHKIKSMRKATKCNGKWADGRQREIDFFPTLDYNCILERIKMWNYYEIATMHDGATSPAEIHFKVIRVFVSSPPAA